MKTKFTLIVVCALFYGTLRDLAVKAQNVGIGTATPAGDAGLEVSFTNRGLLIPRIALTNTGIYGLVGGGPTNSMLVYNTNAAIGGTGAAGSGFYYWNATAGRWVKMIDAYSPRPWFIGGNAETGAAGTAYSLGTTGSHHVAFITNNTERMRITNAGFVGIGTNAPAYDIHGRKNNATNYIAVFENTNANSSSLAGYKNNGLYNALGGVSFPQNGLGCYGVAIAGNPNNGVGVYGTSNSSNALGVRGSIPTTGSWLGYGGYFSGGLAYANGIYNLSDESVKKNIRPIDGALQRILQIQGIYFQYDEKKAPAIADGRVYSGFSAQNISKVLPESVAEKYVIVDEKAERGVTASMEDVKLETKLVVDYVSILPVLVEAVKEQQKQIETLKLQIESLKAELENLKSQR